MFRKEVSKTLRLINDDQDDDLDHCISRIRKEIKKKVTLQSSKKHVDKDVASQCASETLMNLLSAIKPNFQNSLHFIMICNINSYLVNSQPTPLKTALGVLLGNHKMLITELQKYNVSCSYDEGRRLKKSAAVQSAGASVLAGLQDANESGQITIDNYDAVISSQNCRLDCHYMAMLATRREVDSKNLNSLDTTIPRLSKEQMIQHTLWETQVTECKSKKTSYVLSCYK